MNELNELPYLTALEAEAVHVFREVAATFARPVLLFSGGKDSMVMLHVATKAFWPAPVPFPVLHVDTGHNFPEVIRFRDAVVARLGVRLLVGRVQDDIDAGRIVEPPTPSANRNRMQTTTLLRVITEGRFDAVFGGARRDEEKARAKERIFSLRDKLGQWDPRNQRPELWRVYNGRLHDGEHMRVFPLSNWTETDIWCYVRDELIELPSLYYSHDRRVVRRDGLLLPYPEALGPDDDNQPVELAVRFRTVGDMTCTACVPSHAATPEAVIAELADTTSTERGATRMDDRVSDSHMEDRKREGYF